MALHVTSIVAEVSRKRLAVCHATANVEVSGLRGFIVYVRATAGLDVMLISG